MPKDRHIESSPHGDIETIAPLSYLAVDLLDRQAAARLVGEVGPI